jgi:hypothetical protein
MRQRRSLAQHTHTHTRARARAAAQGDTLDLMMMNGGPRPPPPPPHQQPQTPAQPHTAMTTTLLGVAWKRTDLPDENTCGRCRWCPGSAAAAATAMHTDKTRAACAAASTPAARAARLPLAAWAPALRWPPALRLYMYTCGTPHACGALKRPTRPWARRLPPPCHCLTPCCSSRLTRREPCKAPTHAQQPGHGGAAKQRDTQPAGSARPPCGCNAFT